MLEHFGAQDDVEAGVTNAERLSVTDDFDADTLLDVERDPPREVRGIRAVLRANVERTSIARMALRELRWIGYIQMLLFFLIMLAGYIYVWRKGVFDWGHER